MTRRRLSSSEGEEEEEEGRLTPSDRRRIAIGLRLRDLRRRAGLTQIVLAERLGVTQSMVSHLELGRDTPAEAMVERLAGALRLSDEVKAELVDQLADLAVEVNTLRALQRRGDRWIQQQVGSRERTARTLWTFQPALVPGLLQVADYTAAMLRVMLDDPTGGAELLAGREERQRILYDESRRFRFLLTEAVLRTRVARVSVMRAQLRRLLALAEGFDHIEVGVLPTGAPLRRWAMTGFDVMDDVVSVELQHDEVLIRDPHEVAKYRELFEQLWSSGLDGASATALVRRVDRWLSNLAE